MLKKFIKGGNTDGESTFELLSSDEVSSLSSFEKSLLMTIGGLFIIGKSGNERFSKVTLDKKSYDELIIFLKFSRMLKCYLCRAEFSASNVHSVMGKSEIKKRIKEFELEDKSIDGDGEVETIDIRDTQC